VRRLRLIIDSNLADVALVAASVNRVCLYLGLNSTQAGEVELCVAEAVTNSVRHAYHNRSGGTVTIDLAADEASLQITVSDAGAAVPSGAVEKFVRGQAVTPVNSEGSLLPEGGRGLQIIRALMDEVAYAREGDVNCITMRKYLLPICCS
jgi:serine/threonine-protein kinase RsbW